MKRSFPSSFDSTQQTSSQTQFDLALDEVLAEFLGPRIPKAKVLYRSPDGAVILKVNDGGRWVLLLLDPTTAPWMGDVDLEWAFDCAVRMRIWHGANRHRLPTGDDEVTLVDPRTGGVATAADHLQPTRLREALAAEAAGVCDHFAFEVHNSGSDYGPQDPNYPLLRHRRVAHLTPESDRETMPHAAFGQPGHGDAFPVYGYSVVLVTVLASSTGSPAGSAE